MIRTRKRRVEKARVVVKAAKTVNGIETMSIVGETRIWNSQDILSCW